MPPKKKIPASGKDLKRMHAVYYGRVQGVGFRYTAEALAQEIGVMGWVKNLGDGSVEVTAEGNARCLEKFLEAIKASVIGKHIQKVRLEWPPYVGEFSEFRVEFDY